MSRAVCVRCGAERGNFKQICPGCGHRPDGDGLLIAWLLSDSNLDADGLTQVKERIRKGETIRPSSKMLDKARRALGQSLATDRGLSTRDRLLLLGTNLVLTPLVGWVLMAWWWGTRPRAALQALALTLPVSVLFTVIVIYSFYEPTVPVAPTP